MLIIHHIRRKPMKRAILLVLLIVLALSLTTGCTRYATKVDYTYDDRGNVKAGKTGMKWGEAKKGSRHQVWVNEKDADIQLKLSEATINFATAEFIKKTDDPTAAIEATSVRKKSVIVQRKYSIRNPLSGRSMRAKTRELEK